MNKIYLTLLLFFFSINAYSLPVGGISKFFKNLFSKGDEMIDASKSMGKGSDNAIIPDGAPILDINKSSSTNLDRFLDPKTYEGQSFESILEEISAINQEPFEDVKRFFDPKENFASNMSEEDYSFWLEYLTLRVAIKNQQKKISEDKNKVKVCGPSYKKYQFIESANGEVLLYSINEMGRNTLIKKVLNEVFINERYAYKQFHYNDHQSTIQFIFFNDGRFKTSKKQKVYVKGAPSGTMEKCEII